MDFSFVNEETRNKEDERCELWTKWYIIHTYIYNPFENILEEPKFKSLLLVRLLELKKQIRWLVNCVFSGAYYSAIRELRFVFELFVQAYYLDRKYPQGRLKDKLEILKNSKALYGRRLIDKTNLERRDELKNLYGKLSDYSHSSYKELEDKKIVQSVDFEYDNVLFDRCFNLTNEVLDAIIFIIMSFKLEMIKEIQRNRQVMELLEKNDCKLSLSLIIKK